MPVIAVVNRKGGSGKSTLATHLAAHLASRCAAEDGRVLLGDIDRQQSTQVWLKRRAAAKRPGKVVGWTIDPKAMVRPPAGCTHVVLDTPGGLHGFDLARVVMYADVIVMPVGPSAFDRESSADCLAELKVLPRVVAGRCRLAAVGMRIERRDPVLQAMAEWARTTGVELIGTLPYSPHYVRCIDEGATLFDLPPEKVKHELAQWQPVLQWIGRATNIARNEPQADAPRPATLIGSLKGSPRPVVRRAAAAPAAPALAARMSRLLGSMAIPQFLQRNRTAP